VTTSVSSFDFGNKLQFWVSKISEIKKSPVLVLKIFPESKEPLAPGIGRFHEKPA
jgi:hypothetical protein